MFPLPPTLPGVAESVPPLRPGERLTATEFERQYTAMPHLKKAELIKGVVYVGSPMSDAHGSAHAGAIGWLALYRFAMPGTKISDYGTVRLDDGNQPQPDVHLRILPAFGGQTLPSTDVFVEGAPELIVEVAASSVSYDLHEKLDVYCGHRVREYIVWRVLPREIDWFVLEEERFARLPISEDGIYRSRAFPGLWLDPAALLREDGAKVLEVARKGLESPEHAAFLTRLQEQVARLAAPPSETRGDRH
jgi:Uma2 family endonuclease